MDWFAIREVRSDRTATGRGLNSCYPNRSCRTPQTSCDSTSLIDRRILRPCGPSRHPLRIRFETFVPHDSHDSAPFPSVVGGTGSAARSGETQSQTHVARVNPTIQRAMLRRSPRRSIHGVRSWGGSPSQSRHAPADLRFPIFEPNTNSLCRAVLTSRRLVRACCGPSRSVRSPKTWRCHTNNSPTRKLESITRKPFEKSYLHIIGAARAAPRPLHRPRTLCQIYPFRRATTPRKAASHRCSL